MSFFLTLIFFVIIYYLLRMLLKGFFVYRRLRRGDFSDFFGRPGAQSSATRDSHNQRKSGWSAPRPKRKKIAKDVGEYVKYEEIEVETTTSETHNFTDGSSCRLETEQQVEDAVWEEIKDDK